MRGVVDSARLERDEPAAEAGELIRREACCDAQEELETRQGQRQACAQEGR